MNKYSDFVIGERQILKNVLNDSEMTITQNETDFVIGPEYF